MRFLARRDYSTGELRTKLTARGFDRDLVEAVIADCVEHGWVNDEAFALHQSQILADRGWGPAQIRKKLVKHGISNDLAKRTIDVLDVDWLEAARRRISRKFDDPRGEDRERAFRHLTYRGFSSDVARRAVLD